MMTIDEVRAAIKSGETIQQRRYVEDGWRPVRATEIMPDDMLVWVERIDPDPTTDFPIVRTLDELRKVPDA